MTETEWLSGNDLRRKLHFCRAAGVSDRKLRLFAVTCCRLVQVGVTDARSLRSIAVAELYAEGSAGEEELSEAYAAANDASKEAYEVFGKIGTRIHDMALYAAETSAITAAKRVSAALDWAALVAVAQGRWPSPADGEAQFRFVNALKEDAEAMARVREITEARPRILQDIVGNPFRPLAPIDPSVLAWNDSTVLRLAEAAYEERDPATGFLNNTWLSVLADALEEAGVTDASIHEHLRDPGPHVRGCHIVDLLVGKK
jgi:hypothetical protein